MPASWSGDTGGGLQTMVWQVACTDESIYHICYNCDKSD